LPSRTGLAAQQFEASKNGGVEVSEDTDRSRDEKGALGECLLMKMRQGQKCLNADMVFDTQLRSY